MPSTACTLSCLSWCSATRRMPALRTTQTCGACQLCACGSTMHSRTRVGVSGPRIADSPGWTVGPCACGPGRRGARHIGVAPPSHRRAPALQQVFTRDTWQTKTLRNSRSKHWQGVPLPRKRLVTALARAHQKGSRAAPGPLLLTRFRHRCAASKPAAALQRQRTQAWPMTLPVRKLRPAAPAPTLTVHREQTHGMLLICEQGRPANAAAGGVDTVHSWSIRAVHTKKAADMVNVNIRICC